MHKTNLTPCELRTAFLISQGCTFKEAGKTLGKSPETLKCQLRVVYSKTGLSRETLWLLFMVDQRTMEGMIERAKGLLENASVQFSISNIGKFTFKKLDKSKFKLVSWEPADLIRCTEVTD